MIYPLIRIGRAIVSTSILPLDPINCITISEVTSVFVPLFLPNFDIKLNRLIHTLVYAYPYFFTYFYFEAIENKKLLKIEFIFLILSIIIVNQDSITSIYHLINN